MPISSTSSMIALAPALLSAGPVRMLLWFGTGLVVLALLHSVGKHLSRGSETGEFAKTIAANVAQIVIFAVVTFFVVHGLFLLHVNEGIIGSIARAVTTTIFFVAAWAAGLFIARQFLAPPWWRLNAWEPTFASERFGIKGAAVWIWEDIRELVRSLRLIHRIIVLGGVPLAMLNFMAIVGVEQALILIHGSLLVCYLALVVALFTANRIPRALLTRLQDLRAVARRIAGGDLSARVGYNDTAEYEELGELVADVNSMARVLQSREQENHALTQQLHQTLQFEQERASRDPLTQLHNHRYFQEALAAELYRCGRTGEITTIAIIDLDDFKLVNDTHGHQEGDAVLVRTARAFADTLRPYDLPARLGGEEFGVIFPSTSPEEAKMVMDRILQVLATAGPNGTEQTFSGGIASFPIHATDQSMLYQLADSSSYAAKMNGKRHTVVFEPGKIKSVAEDDRVNTRERDAQLRAARTLVQTVDMIEGFGNEHSENVGRVSARIASAMGYDDSFARQMYLCGLLHDVGKLGIEQSLMQKAGQLTPEEYEQVKRHPELSAQIVQNAGLGEIAAWVRHHHENFDGTGYPMGLAGQDIPVGSRIVLAAEAFDVMTTDRPYRHAMSAKDACDELMRGAGTRFDPDVAVTLVNLVRTGDVAPGGGAAPVGADSWDRRAA